MKRYINKREFYLEQLNPENLTAELNFSQDRFSKYLETVKDLAEEGELSADEMAGIQRIKGQISEIRKQYKLEDPSKFDFDLAKIFHKNLKIDRYKLNDFGFWRWLSMNFFLEEIQWRWAKKYRETGEVLKAATAIHDHLVGKSKSHRIFPRRLYIVGLRLYDGSYTLLDKISNNSKSNVMGGYGDFVNYLTDTKLISFNDNVAKTMGRLLLSDKKVKSKDVVIDSFKRYNGFKNRMMSEASEEIFRSEVIREKKL